MSAKPPVKPRVYPVFLPHAGCPFHCVYCDQSKVTASPPSPPDVVEVFRQGFASLVRDARRSGRPGEVAFYGGTFTALPPEIVRTILDETRPHVERGPFTGIRFSTRPDCLGEEVCALLADYPVTIVELGAQSMSAPVLREARRGYEPGTVADAAARVRARGWRPGIQIMAGLPGDTEERFRQTVERTLETRPDLVRIYPALVLNGTRLADWYRAGRYRPLSLEETVERCAFAVEAFERAGVAVARVGLHADPELEKPGTVLAGPHHPAFGHLVRARIWRRRVSERLAKPGTFGRSALLRVPARRLSEALGMKRENVEYWTRRHRLEGIEIRPEPEFAHDRLEVEIRR